MSVLISTKVEIFYCQPVSQFQVQHWKNLTPLINWGTPSHKRMTINQGPRGISQTSGQSAALHILTGSQYDLACTQNTGKFWTRHLWWGLLQVSQCRALPWPLCPRRTQQQLLTVAHSHGSIVIGNCNEVIHVWACSWVADKLGHVQTSGSKHKVSAQQ